MSAAIDRILDLVGKKAVDWQRFDHEDVRDHSTCDSLSFGDWKDAINVELCALKAHALRLATAYYYSCDPKVA